MKWGFSALGLRKSNTSEIHIRAPLSPIKTPASVSFCRPQKMRVVAQVKSQQVDTQSVTATERPTNTEGTGAQNGGNGRKRCDRPKTNRWNARVCRGGRIDETHERDESKKSFGDRE